MSSLNLFGVNICYLKNCNEILVYLSEKPRRRKMNPVLFRTLLREIAKTFRESRKSVNNS